MPTTTAIASSYASMTNLTQNTTYPITRAYTNASSTTYTQLNVSKNKTGTIYFTGFDFSEIPSGATITSVTIKIRCMVSSTTYITAATVQASKGTTLVGSSTNFRSTTNTLYTLTSGTWSRADLDTLRIFLSAKKSNTNSTAYMRIYGMQVDVVWEEPPTPTSSFKVREGSSLTTIVKVLRKSGSSLVEVAIEESMFSTSTKFVRR